MTVRILFVLGLASALLPALSMRDEDASPPLMQGLLDSGTVLTEAQKVNEESKNVTWHADGSPAISSDYIMAMVMDTQRKVAEASSGDILGLGMHGKICLALVAPAIVYYAIQCYQWMMRKDNALEKDETSGEAAQKPTGGYAVTIGWGLCWFMSTAVMNVSNKYAVQQTPICLALLQMLFSCVVLLSLWPVLGLTSLQDVQAMAPWWVVSLFFCFMMVTSLVGFRFESITTVVVMSSVRPIYALMIESRWFGDSFSGGKKLGCLLLFIGTFGYLCAGGYGSFSGESNVHIVGLAFLFLNGVCASIDRCYQRYYLFHRPIKATKAALVLAFNLGSAVLILLMYPLWKNEVEFFQARMDLWSRSVGPDSFDLNMVLLSCLSGLVIGYAGVSFQANVSATVFCAISIIARLSMIALDRTFVGKKMLLPSEFISIIVAFSGTAFVMWPTDDQRKK